MNENRIVLSICIPSYNRKNRVCESVRNILCYEHDDLEVVVCDNASTDGSWETLQEFKDERLKIYRNKENYGVLLNYMKVLLLGSGKFRMLLNDRDQVNIDEIYDFIKEISYKENSVIIAVKTDIRKVKSLNSFGNRTYYRRKYEHPGLFIFPSNVMRKMEMSLGIDPEDWQSCDFAEQVSECLEREILYAEHWYWYHKATLVHQPGLKELKSITVNRKVQYGNIYFTPENRSKILEFCMCLVDVQEKDMNAYMASLYKAEIEKALSDYYYIVKYRPEECERYGYEVPLKIFWLKEAVVFQRKAIECLRRRGNFNGWLRKELFKITIFEYVKLCKTRVSGFKKRLFPQSWIK